MPSMTFEPGDGHEYIVVETLHGKFYRCHQVGEEIEDGQKPKDHYFTLDYKRTTGAAVAARPFLQGDAIRSPLTRPSTNDSE